MDIRTTLSESTFIQAESASEALANGWETSWSPDISLAELEFVYSRRLEHLLSKSSDHAVSLAASTRELLDAVQDSSERVARWVTIRGPANYYFMILTSNSSQILGCLKVVSKLDVSHADWQRLWQGAA